MPLLDSCTSSVEYDSPRIKLPKSPNLTLVPLEKQLSQIALERDWKSLIKGLCEKLYNFTNASFKRLGELADINNGDSDVQDAVLDSSQNLYPFFDRSDEIKFLSNYLFDDEAIIYAGEGSEFYPRYFKGKFALHQRCYAITRISHTLTPKYLYYFCMTHNQYFIRNSVGSTVSSLRLGTFKNLRIPIVSIETQNHIVSILDVLSNKLLLEKELHTIYLQQKRVLLSTLFI